MPTSTSTQESLYPYKPNHALPIIFAVLVGVSFSLHVYQNFRYRFWKVTFFMTWGGAVFTVGWILRAISTYQPSREGVYVAQVIFILVGPPIYAAAEYNTLGRLMRYLPMHAPMHPDRVMYLFIYLGIAVETLTSSGASILAQASSHNSKSDYQTGGLLISIALVLQAAIECVFIFLTALVHRRAARSKMLPRNVRLLCILLYGTSTLVLLRCIFRAVQSFGEFKAFTYCDRLCRVVIFDEWFLYAFEGAPMILYTWWINFMHPGKVLPNSPDRYLDFDGRTERMGPGWVDRRSKWQTFLDPLDLGGIVRGRPSHEEYWLHPGEWAVATNGSFAQGTATNVEDDGKRRKWSLSSRKAP